MKKLYVSTLLFFLSIIFYTQAQPTWNTTGIGGGGALFSPAINPANTSEVFVACDMSELFHSTNFGLSYDIVDFRQLQASHNSSVRFTNNPNLRYCINYANNMIVPVKSTDGGNTWTTLSGNPDASEETYSIWADYNNSSRVLISYYGAVYFSSNGGTSFTNIHNALNSGTGLVVGGVFFNGNNIYIGTNDGLIESSNGGTSFSTLTTTGLPAGESINSFAAGVQGGTTRFFCVTGATSNIYAGQVGSDYSGFLKGVYSMDNNNGTWTPRMTGINASSDFLMFAGMAENDITTAYLGGSNSSGYPNIMKTSDGGLTWSHVFTTANNQNIVTGWAGTSGDHQWGWPECLFGLAVAATDKNIVLFTDYSNPTKTNDGGLTWRQAYVSPADEHPAGAATPIKKYYHSIGMENTAAWYLHWSDASNIFAGYTDIFGTRSTDGGLSWAFDYTAPSTNTIYCITKNISSSTIYAATSSIHDLYKSYRLQDNIIDAGTGKIIFSVDKGLSWLQLHDFGKPVYWLATDPNNSNRMYAAVVNNAQGIGGIWVTNNLSSGAASTWTQLTKPTRTEGHPATMTVLNNGDLLCSFSGRRTTSAFTQSSGIFIYNPSNSTWTDKSATGQQYWCHDVVVDPNDVTQNTWYSGVYSGWGGPANSLGGLYKTTNGGTTWTRILTNNDVSSCTFNPNNANELFVTTHGNGLWHSTNINNATPTFNQLSNYLFGAPERIFFNPFDNTKLWVTSFGNGLQWADLNTTGSSTSAKSENIVDIYPNPSQGSITINVNETFQLKNAEFSDMLGKKVEGIKLEVGETTIHADLTNLPSGIYFIKLETSTKAFIGKFVNSK